MSGLRYRRGIDALRVFGPIYREYQKRGAETGPLHLPIFDQLTEQVLTRFFQNFQHDQTRVEGGDILVLDDTPATATIGVYGGATEAPF
jgi:hypothetical protein